MGFVLSLSEDAYRADLILQASDHVGGSGDLSAVDSCEADL